MRVVESFPTSAVLQRERLDHFQSVVDRVFCPMHVRHTGGLFDSFSGSIEATNLGRVRIAKVAGTQCTVSPISQDMLKQYRSDKPDRLGRPRRRSVLARTSRAPQG